MAESLFDKACRFAGVTSAEADDLAFTICFENAKQTLKSWGMEFEDWVSDKGYQALLMKVSAWSFDHRGSGDGVPNAYYQESLALSKDRKRIAEL